MADFFICREYDERGSTVRENIKEGDLYKIINVDGETFEIRYGYYEEKDRYGKYNDPIPIYPNFSAQPQYNNEGQPFITEMQDICKNFKGSIMVDICCGCSYFQKKDDMIGICLCIANRKRD